MGLDKNFFERKPGIVARTLLGKLLVRKIGSTYRLGMIVETEAYLGEDDKASHSHRGQTKRNAPMFGPAGFSYVYFTYGMHWLLNIVTEKEGKASAVLIRAVEPLNVLGGPADLKKMGSGPARLTKWLRANGEQSNMDLTKSSDLFITDEIEIEGRKYKAVQVAPGMIVATTRIGVDYAEEHKDLPLRFYIKGNKYISKV